MYTEVFKMENEVSGIAKLGIVLIALAVLIGLGFGIFQISKSTANSGITDVQAELDNVSTSEFNTYDQASITGTMLNSAMSAFEGENVAVLVATQAWINLLHDADTSAAPGDFGEYAMTNGSGFSAVYASEGASSGAGAASATELPIIWAYADDKLEDDNTYTMTSSSLDDAGLPVSARGAFINYNALLGNAAINTDDGADAADVAGVVEGEEAKVNSNTVTMGGVYFDSNCFRCVSGFATDPSGRVLFNNVTGNTNKTGRTEYIAGGAKFNSFLVKDASGTIIGIACEQINNG